MTCYNFYSGDCSPADSWSIFRKGDIDLMHGPIEWGVPINGQNGHPPLAYIYGRASECRIVRPFIYDGVTYLSCYYQNWGKNGPNINRRTPNREYTDILKYQGVENLPEESQAIKAETVCRFRMNVAKKLGGIK